MAQDMSKTCDLAYFKNWDATHHDHTMTQEELNEWIAEHCAKCCWMSDICMYGEK